MKRFIIFGLGTFGQQFALQAADLGAHVTAIDIDAEAMREVRNYVTEAQIIDCRDEHAIKDKLKEGYDQAIIAMHKNFGTVLLLVVWCKEMGIGHIVARAETTMQKTVLEKLGIEKIILPEFEMGQRIAERIILNTSEQLVLTPEMGIVHVPVPSKLVGKNLAEFDKLNKYAVRLLFIRRQYLDQNFSRLIETDESSIQFSENDFLILLGNPRRIVRMMEAMS